MNYELVNYREDAIKIAKDLLYGEEVIEQIKNAKTIEEISRIMRNSRRKIK